MESKALCSPLILKADSDPDSGEISAVIATLDVVDRDGDVTVAGAFADSPPVKISLYNHASAYGTMLPVGVGAIKEQGDQAVFSGELFLDTAGGLEAHTTLKRLNEAGSPSEWSYGFEVLESEEGEHKGESVRVLKRLAPFEVSPVMRGAGIDTQTIEVKGQRYVDEAERVLAAVSGFIGRSKSLADLRAQEGRVLSSANRKRLQDLVGPMGDALGDLRELLTTTEPEKASNPPSDMARFRAIQHRIAMSENTNV